MNIISNIYCLESKRCVLSYFQDHNIEEYFRMPSFPIVKQIQQKLLSGNINMVLLQKDADNNWLRLLRLKYQMELNAGIAFGTGAKVILVTKEKTKEIIWGFRYGLNQCISLPSSPKEIENNLRNYI